MSFVDRRAEIDRGREKKTVVLFDEKRGSSAIQNTQP